jgi:cephalosporin hydroxylase
MSNDFQSALGGDTLARIQEGVLQTKYRGRAFLKSPFDVVLYLQLLDRFRPATIIEIGSREGGSALWFADMMSAAGRRSRVISVDLAPPADLVDPRITFLAGDALALERSLSETLLAGLPHPWLVSEDSVHTRAACSAVLRFFDPQLRQGDYIVIEDGIVAALPADQYSWYDNGPNRAVEQFLAERGHVYKIDRALCDHFGHNVTYNPNGWLRRMT